MKLRVINNDNKHSLLMIIIYFKIYSYLDTDYLYKSIRANEPQTDSFITCFPKPKNIYDKDTLFKAWILVLDAQQEAN